MSAKSPLVFPCCISLLCVVDRWRLVLRFCQQSLGWLFPVAYPGKQLGTLFCIAGVFPYSGFSLQHGANFRPPLPMTLFFFHVPLPSPSPPLIYRKTQLAAGSPGEEPEKPSPPSPGSLSRGRCCSPVSGRGWAPRLSWPRTGRRASAPRLGRGFWTQRAGAEGPSP